MGDVRRKIIMENELELFVTQLSYTAVNSCKL